MRLKSPITARGPRMLTRIKEREWRKALFLCVIARAIHVNNGEAKVVEPQRERSGDGEVVNGLIGQLKEAIIPSGDDAARGSDRRLEDEGAKRVGEEGRRKKGGDAF